uniref:Rho GTPase-activating protein 18-like isoform X2 n=1 Tax=Petromyzon marinus TaxID=7757 RepID=A0AAJ7WUC4_PETMA|nr:rho GTPase-activating protein 18-like isoform X2 [Petromyzon marinus]
MEYRRKQKQQGIVLMAYRRKNDGESSSLSHRDSTHRSDAHNSAERAPVRRLSAAPGRVSQSPNEGAPLSGIRRTPTLNLPFRGPPISRLATNGYYASPHAATTDRSSFSSSSEKGDSNGDPTPDSGVSSPRGSHDADSNDDVIDLCAASPELAPRSLRAPGEGPGQPDRPPSVAEDEEKGGLDSQENGMMMTTMMKMSSLRMMRRNGGGAGSSLDLSASVGSGSDGGRRRPSPSLSLSQSSETSGLDSWASQESLDDSQEDLFQREVNKIRRGSEDFTLVEIKTPDENEQEADWLKETGFLTQGERPRRSSRKGRTGAGDGGGDDDTAGDELGLVESDEDEESHREELMSTLSVAQRITVQKRMNNFTQSTRAPDKKGPRDVRDVFLSAVEAMSSDPQERNPLTIPELAIVSPSGMLSAFKPRASHYSVKDAEERQAGSERPPPPERREPHRAPDLGLFRTDIAYSEQGNASHDGPPPELTPGTRLPEFCLSQDWLGATRPDALSPRDLTRMRRVALIELTALFDSLSLQLKRCRAAKTKRGDQAVFGVSLAELLEQDRRREEGICVPRIMEQLIQHLEKQGLDQDGILRVSGNAARVKAARKQLDNPLTRDSFAWGQLSSADAAALLKMFVRELPTPLLTVEYMIAFATVTKINSTRQRIQALNLLVLLLPDANRDTLEALLLLLGKVVSREQQNRMGLGNVAKIMAPNLFMPKGLRGMGREWAQMQAHADTADVVAFLVNYRHIIWTVPAFLLRQVREQNELRQRHRQKEHGANAGGLRFLRRIQGGREGSALRTNPAQPTGVITVRGDGWLRVPELAVDLVRGTTVGDVLVCFEQHVLRQRELHVKSSFLDECCLCETKGNIDERVSGQRGAHDGAVRREQERGMDRQAPTETGLSLAWVRSAGWDWSPRDVRLNPDLCLHRELGGGAVTSIVTLRFYAPRHCSHTPTRTDQRVDIWSDNPHELQCVGRPSSSSGKELRVCGI